MSIKSLFASLAVAGLAFAADVSPTAAGGASTTVPVYLAVTQQPLVASVVTANPSLTSYSITCAPGQACDFAGRGANLTVTDHSIYIMSVNGAAAGTPDNNLLVQCTSFNTASIVCSESQNSILEGGVASSMSVVFTQGADSATMLPLTVTAGVEALAAAASAATATATASTGTAATASASAKGAGVNVQASLAGVGMAAIAALLM
jgi:hypothetical protein